MDLEQATIDGVPTRWIEQGSGRPVVLVHGAPTSPRLWRHVMPLVEGRSLAREMTGYGTSIADGHGRSSPLPRDLGRDQRSWSASSVSDRGRRSGAVKYAG